MDRYNIWWKNTDGSLRFGDGNTTSKEYKEATPDEVNAWQSRIIVPQSATKLQIMEAMLETDVTTTSTMWKEFKAIRATNEILDDYWLSALNVNRNHPMTLGMKTIMNKTDADIDALFVLANSK